MSIVTIKISGPGGTFEAITVAVSELLKQFGANITVNSDIGDYNSLKEKVLENTETDKLLDLQIKGRTIIIDTNNLPWGG